MHQQQMTKIKDALKQGTYKRKQRLKKGNRSAPGSGTLVRVFKGHAEHEVLVLMLWSSYIRVCLFTCHWAGDSDYVWSENRELWLTVIQDIQALCACEGTL